MITELKTGTILYHGSYCEVRTPDIARCRKNKDFGQGFYLTTDLEQAKQFARITSKKAIENRIINEASQYVSVFEYTHNDSIKSKIYPTADDDWLHCVVAHRKRGLFENIIHELEETDIIGGKIANDQTNATILTYMAGTFGKPGTESVDNTCINLLIPERLKDQYCFRTQKALECLTFRRCIRL